MKTRDELADKYAMAQRAPYHSTLDAFRAGWDARDKMAQEEVRELREKMDQWKLKHDIACCSLEKVKAERDMWMERAKTARADGMNGMFSEWILERDSARARVAELEKALTVTRGQWINSVNAEQCLKALEAKEAGNE